MKKLKLFFTAILLLCCVGTATAHDFEEDGIYYNTLYSTEKTVEVTSGTNKYTGSVVIPESVTYNGTTYSVTSIGGMAFNSCDGLTSITIPNSVTSIGFAAFYGCTGLTSITIPNSVTSIGNGAFYGCTGLTSIVIGNSVTSIGDCAFEGTVWYNNQPDGVVYAGKVLYKYKGTMPSNTSITIKDGTLGIADDAFDDCTGLTSITIPNSVTSIGHAAFWGCSGLTLVEIPNSVTSIGNQAFENCTGLASIKVESGNSVYDSRENCNAIIETATNELIVGCQNTIIPNSVTSIGEMAFRDCTGLTSITIPNSITSIGNSAFSGCDGLTSITIPNSVTYIGNQAFYWCKGLTSVVIPNSVTSIGNGAFLGCTGLTSIKIPNSVTSIGSSAFYGTAWYNNQPDGVVYAGKVLYEYNGTMPSNTSITIKDGTLGIAGYAFLGCTGLKSITIPNSVTSIGEGAFYECTGLTSIVIGDSVTSIGEWAFCDCKGLTSIVIGNSVTSIGEGAFTNCTGLTSITIPNSVTSIEEGAFSGTAWYNNQPDGVVYAGKVLYKYKGTMPSNTSITIKDGTLGIADDAFDDCTGLTSITIPNSVTSIGDWAFYNCTGLTLVEIPNSVTSIGEGAFVYCLGLKSVTIGTGVENIGEGAFAKCENLANVYCLATSVPETDSDAFNESYPEYMTLHVPEEAIDNYRTTAPWSNFGTIVKLDGEDIIEPEVKICAMPTVSYSNGKLHFECETEGAEFVTEITSSDFNKFYNNDINLTATYNISVYATATGYENSDIVNATLCWIECECEGDDTGIINIPAKAVLVTSSNGSISISCSLDGESVSVYTTAGTLIAKTTIENGAATVATGLSKGSVAIVKIADKSIKVAVN